MQDALCIAGNRIRRTVNTVKKPLKPFFGEQFQDHLDAEVSLPGFDVLCIQKALEVRRSGVGRIQLGKRWRYE